MRIVLAMVAAFGAGLGLGQGSATASGLTCDRWHPYELDTGEYAAVLAGCTTAQQHSMVFQNISTGVVRIVPFGATHLHVNADHSQKTSIIESALDGPCFHYLVGYCDLRPGRRLVAETGSSGETVNVSIDLPAGESLKVQVASDLIDAALRPHLSPPVAAIITCVQNVRTTVTAGTQAQQVRDAITGTSSCGDAMTQIRKLARGASEPEPLISAAGIARTIVRSSWIDEVALDAIRVSELIH